MKPRIIDLYCCAGGAARGYQLAGFEVVGVDAKPQPNYCGDMFIQDDALAFLAKYGHKFAARHASPPCQGETVLQFVNDNRDAHPRLIEPTRALLRQIDGPYVMENVIGADLIDPVSLCGEMFGLGVVRHRLFETNWPLRQPEHVPHRGLVRGWRHGKYQDGPYVAVYGKGGGKANLAEASAAMGIDWMTYDEIREAIPPAYTEYIGRQLMTMLSEAAA